MRSRGLPVASLVSDLSGIRPKQAAHLDPDLDPTTLKRSKGWRPAFGQANAAAGHLTNQQVGLGDLFLFFGWFRRVELLAGRWRYIKTAPDLHVLFGWLRVGEILDPLAAEAPRGLERHPHFDGSIRKDSRVYVGKSTTDGGVFGKFAPALQLSVPGPKRSRWRLPKDFFPGSRTPLSYHQQPKRWQQTENACILQSAGRGQEFVVDCKSYPSVRRWAEKLIEGFG